jgi:sec-independent protein translocase protein TatA
MFGLGATELAIILAIVVVLFGARRLPEIGAGVGKAIKNFKSGVSDDEIDVTPEKGQVSEQSSPAETKREP